MIDASQIIIPPVDEIEEAPSASPELAPLPVLVPLDSFPNQPSGSSPKLPATLPNIEHLLKASGIAVSHDVIRKRTYIVRGGQALTESDLVSLANFNRLNGGWFDEFVSTIAQRNPVNPVADWIDSKPWDGEDRLQALYATVEVEDDFPLGMRDILLHRWLLSAVAAAKVPTGFRTRGVLTLQGSQGLGKTSWIGRLVPAEMRQDFVKLDHHLDPHNKDSVLGALSHWIVEIGELDSSFRKDVARLKGYLTNDCDKIRPPYGKRPIEMVRRTVHAATVNERNFLVDDTGNSRWFTLPVVKLDYQHEIDMQQVFAQLAVELAEGAHWWLSGDEELLLDQLNASHRAVSAIAERIKDRLIENGPTARYMTAAEVLKELGVANPSNAQCKEAGTVLRSILGAPKRVQGRDRWKVAIRGNADAWQPSGLPLPPEDEEY